MFYLQKICSQISLAIDVCNKWKSYETHYEYVPFFEKLSAIAFLWIPKPPMSQKFEKKNFQILPQ